MLFLKKFEEKTIGTEHIFKGKVISLQVDEVVLPNGNHSKREIVKHPGAVAIIPITDHGTMILVEQYRKALERSIIEIPAGKLEQGEKPEMTALRELEEETGLGCKELTHITSFSTSPGFADEIIHIYSATGLYKIEESAPADDDEFVEMIDISVEEAEEMMADGRIYDAKTAFAVLWMKQYLKK
ncbi:NUDIX hydrolase [Chungangia koreensis]|uniref:NUDIX hydrolase n=1 Tax=Chungangia koreensis TaxID=752657 RepID=A0ABV8X7A4_9LACT